jgi:hypothetical protein
MSDHRLLEAHALHTQDPSAYIAPSRGSLEAIRRGWSVQIGTEDGKRWWLRVIHVQGDAIAATISAGDAVRLERRNVLAVLPPRGVTS